MIPVIPTMIFRKNNPHSQLLSLWRSAQDQPSHENLTNLNNNIYPTSLKIKKIKTFGCFFVNGSVGIDELIAANFY